MIYKVSARSSYNYPSRNLSTNYFNRITENPRELIQYKSQVNISENCARIQDWYFFPGVNLYFCTNGF